MQSPACQKRSWKTHKRVCKPAPELPSAPPPAAIPAVRLRGPIFLSNAIEAEPTHAVWTAGEIAPVSQLVGIPLLVYRDDYEVDWATNLTNRLPDRQNQSATYMMIKPEDGFAPPRWQDNIGVVSSWLLSPQ